MFSSFLTLTSLLSIALATPSNSVPEDFDGQPWPVAPRFNYSLDASVHTNGFAIAALNGKVQMGYFTNWGSFPPTSIPTSHLTHIVYAFADCNPTTGALTLSNTYADTQQLFAGDDGAAGNLFGNFKQLYLLKKANRGLKTLLSVGGWTYGQDGHFNFVTSASARATFISTAITALEDYGFDGIDIDYEYPASTAQGQGFADLLTGLRSALTQHAASKGDSVPYLITAAVGAGSSGYTYLNVPQMNTALDIWSLMAYDYAGSWSPSTDYQANLKGNTPDGVSTVQALGIYTSKGASLNKIAMGIPLYARSFTNTAGMFQSFSGVGGNDGITNYNSIPGGTLTEETSTYVGAYTMSGSTLYSYDTTTTANVKAQYINSNGLAGAMYWELSGDKTGSSSVVSKVHSTLGGLDTTQNHLNYPGSQYANVRNQMGGQGPITTTTTTTGGPTQTPPAGSCDAVGAWSATLIYVGGDQATYAGWLWQAQWWTQGETPKEGDGLPWKRVSQC
ncbi:carbohydrate-binding module family 5 protein [Atractiella rhizophila]|nr:carbohydrate-binding module family 5 protein [Atractiella rhizophila]